MDVSLSKNRRHVISNLKPYTQYAYFVKTLTRTDYHMQVDAYSKILYFRTLPSKPSPVSQLHGSSDHSTQIVSDLLRLHGESISFLFDLADDLLVATCSSQWHHIQIHCER